MCAIRISSAIAIVIASPAIAAAQPAATTTPVIRTDHTISGQPLRLPQGTAEFAGAIVDIPVGAIIPLHKHPWSRFAFIARGTIRVVNRDTGAVGEYKAGQMAAEAVDQWHEGSVVGDEPVRLIIFEILPPGVANVVPYTAPAPAQP
jgi:quercetin dioxygenase-like cupin family protein